MKKLFALILWTAALAPFTAQSQQPPGTLAGFLSGQGLVGAKLERRSKIIFLFQFPLTTSALP